MVKIPAEMDKLTANEWREIGFSRAEFEDRWKARLERDKGSPAIGSDAPDFELEVLSRTGKRTGNVFKALFILWKAYWSCFWLLHLTTL